MFSVLTPKVAVGHETSKTFILKHPLRAENHCGPEELLAGDADLPA